MWRCRCGGYVVLTDDCMAMVCVECGAFLWSGQSELVEVEGS